MRKAGLYIHKETGDIWFAEDVEHYEASVTGTKEFSIVVSGEFRGTKILRCLMTKRQYKYFKYIGSFK